MVYPPIPLWFAKWIMGPGLIIVGIAHCRFAYLKRHDTKRFRIRDLFRRVPIRESSKQQLLIEGLICIALGVVVFKIF
jgi:hypothetical protein